MNIKSPAQLKDAGLKLLIADDEPVILEQLAKLGEVLGFEVHTGADGEEAWEVFKTVWPDIAILDIYMPRMNGLMLLNKIKEANDNCITILITGYTHYKQLVHKNYIKPDGFITKPFSLETMVREIVKLATEYKLLVT